MYQRIRQGLRLLGKDIRALLPALVAVAVYWTMTHLLFDRFCPMQILFGLPCPGCGMTRALILVLTGRFAAAWNLQPPVYGWIAAGVAFGIQRYLVNVGESEAKAKMWTWVLIFLLLWGIGLYLWRIIYGFPANVEDPGRTLYEAVRSIFD